MLKVVGFALALLVFVIGCAAKEVKPETKDVEPTMAEDAGVAEDAQEDAWTED